MTRTTRTPCPSAASMLSIVMPAVRRGCTPHSRPCKRWHGGTPIQGARTSRQQATTPRTRGDADHQVLRRHVRRQRLQHLGHRLRLGAQHHDLAELGNVLAAALCGVPKHAADACRRAGGMCHRAVRCVLQRSPTHPCKAAQQQTACPPPNAPMRSSTSIRSRSRMLAQMRPGLLTFDCSGTGCMADGRARQGTLAVQCGSSCGGRQMHHHAAAAAVRHRPPAPAQSLESAPRPSVPRR